jgi:hypothetical protein
MKAGSLRIQIGAYLLYSRPDNKKLKKSTEVMNYDDLGFTMCRCVCLSAEKGRARRCAVKAELLLSAWSTEFI